MRKNSRAASKTIADTLECNGGDPYSSKLGRSIHQNDPEDDKVYLDDMGIEGFNLRLNGNDIDINNQSHWNKYRPWLSTILGNTSYGSTINKYKFRVEMKCPDHCTTAEMRRFKYIGFDLIIGHGNHSTSAPYLHKAGSFVIDGYNNGYWADLDSYSASSYIQWNVSLDLSSTGVIKARNNSQLHYNGNAMTWGHVHNYLRHSGVIYLRGWVRTRHFSGTDQNSTNGFMYTGYDNMTTPGQVGHTFNNGILLKIPQACMDVTNGFILYNHEDGRRKSTMRYEWFYDPYVSVYRGKASGAASASGEVSFAKNVKIVNVDWIVWFAWSTNGEAGPAESRVRKDIIGSSMPNSSKSEFFNNEAQGWLDCTAHSGKTLLGHPRARIYPYGTGDGAFYSVDYGSSHYGWNVGTIDTTSGGTNPWQNPSWAMSFRQDNKVNTFPTVAPQYVHNGGHRYNTILYPYNTSNLKSYADGRNGEGMWGSDTNGHGILVYAWKLRSRAVYEFSESYYEYDAHIANDPTKHRDMNITADFMYTKICERWQAIFGADCSTHIEYKELGIEHGAYDRHSVNGYLKESDYAWSGAGWQGVKLESTAKNIKCINWDTYNAGTTVWTSIDGEKVEVTNSTYPTIYFTCKPNTHAGKRYFLTAKLCDNVGQLTTSGGHSEKYLLGKWGGDHYNDKWANWSTTHYAPRTNLTNHFKFGSNTKQHHIRGKFVKIFVGVITTGKYDYQTNWDYSGNRPDTVHSSDVNTSPGNHTYRYYLNIYPDTALSIVRAGHYTDNMYMVINTHATDKNRGSSVFKLKRIWVVITGEGSSKSYTKEYIANANATSYSKDQDSFITPAVISIYGSIKAGIGKNITFTMHANNNFDYGDTSDGTRDYNSNGTRPYVVSRRFDLNPNMGCTVSNTIGESVNITITRPSTYDKHVDWILYARHESTSAWTEIGRSSNTASIAFNPSSKNFSSTNRGKRFKFKILADTSVVDGFRGETEYDYLWRWNSIPTCTLSNQSGAYCTDSGMTFNNVTNAFTSSVYTGCTVNNDGNLDQTRVYYGMRYAGDKWMYDENIAHSTSDTYAYSAANLDVMYPCDLNTLMYRIAKAKDSHGMFSPVAVSTTGIKFLDPVIYGAISVKPVSGFGTQSGSIIHGTKVEVTVPITHTVRSKFVNTDWKYRHFIYAREKNGSTDDSSKYFYISNVVHAGNSIPSSIKFTVDMMSNSKFIASRTYEFRIYTRVTKYNGSSDIGGTSISERIYQMYTTGFYGSVMFGKKPDAPRILYPVHNSVFNCGNPSLIISCPTQSNPSNVNMTHIGLDKGTGSIGWYTAAQLGVPDFNGRNIKWVWREPVSAGAKDIKIYIKSGMTNMISDPSTCRINVTTTNYQKSHGDVIAALHDIRAEVNRLRVAYGLSASNFTDTSSGVHLTFNNAVTVISDEYNDVITKINSYTGTFATALPMNISNQTLIMADHTKIMHDDLKKIKTT